jgi:hypothetical protein
MSFLGAAFLLALPLVAVPVAIHLYRGRQRDVILWGAMQFLAAAVTKGRRMERLEELLLMLLRFGAVAALILALAQPMVRSRWLGQATEREVILVLDNSLSMSREVGEESVSERMRQKALDAIDSLDSADGVQILLGVGGEWATVEPITADSSGKRRLQEIVESVEATQGSANLLACLQDAIHLQSESQLSGRRVLVFTDSQAKSWQLDQRPTWQQLSLDREASRFPISIAIVDCGLEESSMDNLAVALVEAERGLVRPGDQVKVAAEVVNTGDVPSEEGAVEWLVADKVVRESPLRAIEPRAKTQVTATLRMAEAGVFAITCRIKHKDQLPLDQENSVVVEVAGELPILFVQGEDGGDPAVAAPNLLAAALGFKNGEPQEWHSVFRPEAIPAAALAAQPLDEYRAVLLNNVGDLDRATLDKLDSFARSGGGIWLAIGDNVDSEEFNRDWYSDGDGVSPLAIDSLHVIEQSDDMAGTVHPPTRDHQATLQLANTTQLDIDEARIRQRWQFAEKSAADDAISALLESGDGEPLVVEKYVGQGRVLVQAYPLGLEWSNLPLLKAYVVMIHDWLSYVTAPRTARYNLSPGAPIYANAPKEASSGSTLLVTPRGKELPLAAADAEGQSVYRYSQTRIPGLYRVRFRNQGAPVGEVPFVVARDATESDLSPLEEADRVGVLAGAGVQMAGAEETLTQQAESAPRLDPFWGVLLVALVALLIGELLLSTWLARQRSGLAVHTV